MSIISKTFTKCSSSRVDCEHETLDKWVDQKKNKQTKDTLISTNYQTPVQIFSYFTVDDDDYSGTHWTR